MSAAFLLARSPLRRTPTNANNQKNQKKKKQTRREIVTQGSIEHPNIVRIFHAEEINKQMVMLMPHAGVDLGEAVRASGGCGAHSTKREVTRREELVSSTLRPVLQALAALHAEVRGCFCRVCVFGLGV